ncbi:penicillin-binding protein, 1A family [Parvibaculum lavamentivorans DS-1]|uniref:Penicillin-binding protein, 1A family n=1 Tax=Parvibaculum lavamentivorans (strain DS-1 / DSM 13023 / NCIMB 13966) TaxID=402881 RepID=A7HNZ8_PARL1|nr:PBP1A family penicillin-binding protein [Parvibaculum lavamentivorans]ABS61631.1 penicillin-binding protein, 1A family [Parvibaculum lavamentivorans DS-1]
MSSRKGKSGPGKRGGAEEEDWTIVRMAGLRPVRLGVNANADARLDEEGDGDDMGWDDDWEGPGMRRTEPTFTRGKPRKPTAKPAKKPAAKKSRPKKPPVLRAPTEDERPGSRTPPRKSARRGAPPRKGKPTLLGRLAYGGAVLMLWGVIAFGGLLFWYGLHLPDTSGLYNVKHTPSLSIVATNGEVLSHRGDLMSGYASLSDLPPWVPAAVLATEDQRFYWHFGVDPIGLARATITNIRAGAYVQGGSTVTQQLAKNIFLKPDRTIARKIEEMVLAVWLELRFTKEEILTLYLNRVYFGGGAYGLEAASERYFRKPARALTLPEAAMLAGLLKAPSRYSPTNNIELARNRAAIVLQNMVNAGYITQEEARTANVSPARLEGYAARGSINYFVDWVAEAVPDYAGRPDTDVNVMTTIDPVLQREAERVIDAMLAGEGAAVNATQAALVAMTPDGAVRAMVGGRSYAQSQFNRAVQAKRQPGSAFKPIVYLAALERGLTPDTLRVDRPIEYGGWAPANYSGRFEGEMTLRTALAKSVNTVAVQVARETGIRNVIAAARRLGLQEDLPSNLSLALGSGSVNLLELTAAYATFANGGYGVIPHGIEEVRSESGEELYRRQGSGIGRVVDGRTVGQMNNMLQAVMAYGTGRNSALGARPSGGKTGTSQDFRDAWFIGYTADLVVGVWVGNDNGAPMEKVTGGTLPAHIWHDFMMKTQEGVPIAQLPEEMPVATASASIAAPAAMQEAAPAEYEWEQPGFFERLFGIGGNEDSTLRAGGRR